jgi:hypothetical protein
MEVYIIIVEVDGIKKYGTKTDNTLGTLRNIPGALAYRDLHGAATELQIFRGVYGGGAYLFPINMKPFFGLNAENKITFDQRIYDALKEKT